MPSPYTSNYGVTVITDATATISEELHNGHTIFVQRAAGSTLTLPAATGSGMRFRVVCDTPVSSNALLIQCAGADLFHGALFVVDDTFAADESDDNQISLNGGTTGGDGGDFIDIVDLASGDWYVTGVLHGAGTAATPFGTIA